MQIALALIMVFGQATMTMGVIWAMLAGTFRGSLLPAYLQDWESALALATIGGFTWIGGRAVQRLVEPTPVLAESAKPSNQDEHDWNDPAFRKSVMDFVKTSVAEDIRHQHSVLKDHVGRAQERVCLRAAWPQRQTASWVGGRPHLPEGMEWPAVDGRPATFLAQIALEDMPESLWQGLGPRTGWLVYFGDPDRSTHVSVRHVSGVVAPRAQPGSVRNNWHFSTDHAALEGVVGSIAHEPLRWFLEPVNTAGLGAVEDMEEENPDFWDDEKGDYIWAPQWPMVRGELMNKIAARYTQQAADPALPHPQILQSTPQVIEHYARFLYTTQPENLPNDLFALCAPYWEMQCRETLIFVGRSHPGSSGRQPDARLIDLPPNPLVGVTFGDDSRFYVDLPAEDLAEGRFFNAISCDTHGVY